MAHTKLSACCVVNIASLFVTCECFSFLLKERIIHKDTAFISLKLVFFRNLAFQKYSPYKAVLSYHPRVIVPGRSICTPLAAALGRGLGKVVWEAHLRAVLVPGQEKGDVVNVNVNDPC